MSALQIHIIIIIKEKNKLDLEDTITAALWVQLWATTQNINVGLCL